MIELLQALGAEYFIHVNLDTSGESVQMRVLPTAFVNRSDVILFVEDVVKLNPTLKTEQNDNKTQAFAKWGSYNIIRGGALSFDTPLISEHELEQFTAVFKLPEAL